MIPTFTFAGGRISNQPYFTTAQAPFSNFNTTYDVVANLTKVIGPHAAKAGFYYQKSLKDQSAFAAFNGNYAFDNSSQQPVRLEPSLTRTRRSGSTPPSSRRRRTSSRSGGTRTTSGTSRTTGRPAQRLTLDYGVRFYYLTPQWDVSKQASNFLPEEFDAAAAVRLYRPAVVNGVRVGYDAATRRHGECRLHRPDCAGLR